MIFGENPNFFIQKFCIIHISQWQFYKKHPMSFKNPKKNAILFLKKG